MAINITFTDLLGVSDIYRPRPAVDFLPYWYKETPEYTTDERKYVDGNTPHTIKKCIPVFDALTAGYVIPTFMDVQVTHRGGFPWYEWKSLNGSVMFHPAEQAPIHPSANNAPYPKWSNPWAIKTPPGYSCLFLPPMHNPNNIFTVLPGIVDTDKYFDTVNLPFVLDNVQWEGIIPAGTPMVQVIPFRRDSYKMSIGTDTSGPKEVLAKLTALLFNSYKRQFWSRKEYR